VFTHPTLLQLFVFDGAHRAKIHTSQAKRTFALINLGQSIAFLSYCLKLAGANSRTAVVLRAAVCINRNHISSVSLLNNFAQEVVYLPELIVNYRILSG
jgi:hypothetical protein